jgi:hypothetical protein
VVPWGRFASALILATLLSYRGIKKRSLSKDGAVAVRPLITNSGSQSYLQLGDANVRAYGV